MTCPIRGDAQVSEYDGELRWDYADPETHVSVELLDQLDNRGRMFLYGKYEISEPCPYQPGTVHARRKDSTDG